MIIIKCINSSNYFLFYSQVSIYVILSKFIVSVMEHYSSIIVSWTKNYKLGLTL